MVFDKKYSSRRILLTDQVLLFGYLIFVRYKAICILPCLLTML